MKKRVVAIITLAISVVFPSCIFMGPSIRGNGNVVEETRAVDNFSKIKTSKGANVYISQGDVEKVVVKADENIVDFIRTEVEDGVLIITNTRPIRNATSNKVYVTVKEIEKISAFAGSNVYSETQLKNNRLELSSSAGSNIKLDLSTREIKVSASAGANVYLKGETENFEASASAGSNIKAEGLKTKKCQAKVNSGENVYITVTDVLDARASSGGNIFYCGNPKNQDISSSSGGNVKKR
jgi:Holliday junction resolvase